MHMHVYMLGLQDCKIHIAPNAPRAYLYTMFRRDAPTRLRASHARIGSMDCKKPIELQW